MNSNSRHAPKFFATTGFGCRFCEGFTDLMGSVPDSETSRRSHLLQEEARDPDIQSDMKVQGHQWSIGMSGMSLYFSLREKFALSIESGAGDGKYKGKQNIRSKWVSPMDVSNVIPKTVFSVEVRALWCVGQQCPQSNLTCEYIFAACVVGAGRSSAV